MKKINTLNLVFCALFAALTAVLSQFAIPIGPVPINLATMSLFIAGAVLGSKLGGLSQLVYVLLGAAGLPVFSGFSGGLQVIAGPTGGYIIGYIATAWLVGFITEHYGKNVLQLIIAMVIGYSVCLFMGTIWFMGVTKTGLWQSLSLCVFPFLIGDALKMAASVAVIPQLSKIFGRIKMGQNV